MMKIRISVRISTITRKVGIRVFRFFFIFSFFLSFSLAIRLIGIGQYEFCTLCVYAYSLDQAFPLGQLCRMHKHKRMWDMCLGTSS